MAQDKYNKRINALEDILQQVQDERVEENVLSGAPDRNEVKIGVLNNSIIAQCTPQGSGAIALLRLSGDNAFTIADAISR